MKSWAAAAAPDAAQIESSHWVPSAVDNVSYALNAGLLRSVASLAMQNRRLIKAAASARAQHKRLNWELRSAREVQECLFPQSGVSVAGLNCEGQCRPAEDVGGDYYDFVPMQDGRLGLAVGDVSGKGVPAALLMATLQASLRGLAQTRTASLSSMIATLNLLFYTITPINRYATLFYGAYDRNSREFTYINCGHTVALVFRGDKVLRLEEGGSPVGMFSSTRYKEASITLLADDLLIIYSDGISEASNSAGQEFGDERLIKRIRAGRHLKPSQLISHVFTACDAFIGSAPQSDDMTMLVARLG